MQVIPEDSTAPLAHDAYTAAINSNDVDSIMEMMTEDVVFLAAHAPPMIGKAAVRPWVEGFHRDPDGTWRVARDAFGTDRPLPTP